MEPKLLFVRVSENCNAGCFMCHFAHSHGKYNITDEQFENLINKANEAGTYELVRFTGGEPLLHPNLIKYINLCGSYGYETSIITNGSMLPHFAEALAESSINQIIISIDGSYSELNDKLRGLHDGLNKIKTGVSKIKSLNPNIKFRANTVVSDLNIEDLNNIYSMLDELGFDSWSIIPIRPTDDPNTRWNTDNLEKNMKLYKEFLEKQREHLNIDLLGYSSNWAGQTEEEIINTFTNKFRVVPANQCNIVDLIRFYIPDQDLLVPCNCAAHRIHQIEAEYNDVDDKFEKANIMAEWLRENGPTSCSGCEPLNAYLADNPKLLKKGSFKY